MKLRFLKKTEMNIVVIGGTRGIGKEVVKILAGDANNHLLVTGRDESSLKSLEKEFINIKSIVLDLMEIDTVAERFRSVVYSYFDRIDILINMAGLLIKKDFDEFTVQESRAIMETNFFGPASVIRILKPGMVRGSHIINISSMGGFQGASKYRGLSYYSASKAALACLTECLALEFSESGISVNCLALGSVQTEMVQEAFPGYKAPVEPREMAEFVAGFAMTGNKYFNGKILPVAVTNP
jgi:NAD(P)-dependent dehydrogenase (short-subunit alcohol dehydrogenase family)